MDATTTMPATARPLENSPASLSRPVRWLATFTLIYALALVIYLALRFALGDSLWWLALLHNFTPYYFLPLLLLIPLLFILRARRMAVRLLPVLLVGLLMYGPRWLPRNVAAAADETPTLKLVTFNILMLTEDFGPMADWLRSTDADVILLQEIIALTPDEVFEPLADLYPHTVDLTGTSIVMLSRYPVLDAETINLGTSWFIDRVELDIEGQPVAIYNVHLAMPFMDETHLPLTFGGSALDLVLHYNESRRNALIHRLLDLVQAEDMPTLMAGDFNTSDNALIYNEMAAVMGDSFRETNTGLGTTWPASIGDDGIPTAFPTVLRLDYVWHSEHFRALATEIGPDLGSDHLPLIATLTQP